MKDAGRARAVMDWESLSDADLARQCRQGRSEAWRQLIRRCAPTAYRVSMQVLRDEAEADDACQEVFMRVYRSFERFDPTRPLGPWIAKITYNVCLRRREGVIKNATELVPPADLHDVRDGNALDPECEAARREASAFLARALGGLSAGDRALLTLRYREGLSDAELADVADMPVNTVKTRIFRARARLKRVLAPVLRGGSS